MCADISPVNSSQILTISGPVDSGHTGVVDAHNHLWIASVRGAASGSPVLDNQPAILEELIAYGQVRGRTILDCQPGGCGRNGRILRILADASGVNIVACTAFHLCRYYPPDYWIFIASTDTAAEYFITELKGNLDETRNMSPTVRAGFIKIACEETLERSPRHLIQAAVAASMETGAAIEVHTEKGVDAERILEYMIGLGLPVNKLVLCHMDKRPDLNLHCELARAGVLLEYDTFYRPKYHPEANVWPLLVGMVEAGFGSRVAIATDMADRNMWSYLAEGPGLTGLLLQIIPRMKELGFKPDAIQQLSGGNIAACLARPCTHSIPN